MSRFFCSECGTELVHTRRAVPGKGMILDLIEPHECEGYAVKSDEFGRPTVKDLIEQAKPLGKAKIVSKTKEEQQSFPDGGDKRKDVKSTAPKSLIDALHSNRLETSGDFEDE